MAVDRKLRQALIDLGLIRSPYLSDFGGGQIYKEGVVDEELREVLSNMNIVSTSYGVSEPYGMSLVFKVERLELQLKGIMEFLNIKDTEPMIPMTKKLSAKKEGA